MVDLKRTDCQLLIQQRWVSSGSEQNGNPQFTTKASHEQIPLTAGEEVGFYREGGRNKGPLASHWLSPCQQRSLFPCWALLSA